MKQNIYFLPVFFHPDSAGTLGQRELTSQPRTISRSDSERTTKKQLLASSATYHAGLQGLLITFFLRISPAQLPAFTPESQRGSQPQEHRMQTTPAKSLFLPSPLRQEDDNDADS